MEQDIQQKFAEQDRKLEEISLSLKKMRRYFLTSLIIRVVVIILPLIGLAFAIPWMLNIMSQAYEMAGL